MSIQIDEDENTLTSKYRHIDKSQWHMLFHQDFDEVDQEDEEQEELTFDIQGFMAGNKVAVKTNYNSDKEVIYEYDLLKQEFTKLLYEHPKYDISSAQTNSNSSQLVSVSYFDHGKLTMEYFDTLTSKEFEKLSYAFKDKQLVIVSKHTPSNTMIVRTLSPIDPGSYYYYDGKINEAMLIQEKYLKLVNYKFGPTETIMVPIADDIKIEAYLTQPLERSHNTLLVMPHGGPIGIREYNSFNREVQYYVSRGFSVLRVKT